jgi:hypothetical protein
MDIRNLTLDDVMKMTVLMSKLEKNKEDEINEKFVSAERQSAKDEISNCYQDERNKLLKVKK